MQLKLIFVFNVAGKYQYTFTYACFFLINLLKQNRSKHNKIKKIHRRLKRENCQSNAS